MIMTITIKDALNGRAFPDAGAYLYDTMMSNIDTQDKFIWDLSGVSELPSMFLNMCLAKLVKERGAEFVKSRISFANITKAQAHRIVDYVNKISAAN